MNEMYELCTVCLKTYYMYENILKLEPSEGHGNQGLDLMVSKDVLEAHLSSITMKVQDDELPMYCRRTGFGGCIHNIRKSNFTNDLLAPSSCYGRLTSQTWPATATVQLK